MRAIAGMLLLAVSAAPLASDDDLRRCGAIKSDLQRLDCFDGLVPKDAPALPADPLREAVDRMLASSLLDPMSAIDYQVSGTLACKSITQFWKDADTQCVCYSVNAKNRLGGYTGAKMSFAVVTPIDPAWFALAGSEVETAEGVRACAAAGLQNRPASLIAASVNR